MYAAGVISVYESPPFHDFTTHSAVPYFSILNQLKCHFFRKPCADWPGGTYPLNSGQPEHFSHSSHHWSKHLRSFSPARLKGPGEQTHTGLFITLFPVPSRGSSRSKCSVNGLSKVREVKWKGSDIIIIYYNWYKVTGVCQILFQVP